MAVFPHGKSNGYDTVFFLVLPHYILFPDSLFPSEPKKGCRGGLL
jgi:hypothetical protein